jgi:beta-N-acetylhexosaminidase
MFWYNLRMRNRECPMRKFTLGLSIIVLLVAGCAHPKPTVSKPPIVSKLLPAYTNVPEPIPQVELVDAMMEKMTLDEKVGQLVVAGFYGTEIGTTTTRLITEAKVGGIIFFGRNITTSSQLVAVLNGFKSIESKIPLFLSVDEEGGSVHRLPDDLVNLPNARSFAKRNILNITYDLGVAIGYALNQYGFNVNYAPILDVVKNTMTSSIGSRSFSADPVVVSELGMLMAAGMESQNVIPVVKHFPGHGNTSTDSHAGIPVLYSTLDQLKKLELAPFAYAIERKIPAIMVGHIALSAFDRNLPASISYPILTGLLRGSMGFEGVIFTDDLGMGAISAKYTQAQAAVLSILAGADVVLVSHGIRDPFNVVAALKKAVLDGRISQARLEASVRRILLLKLAYGLDSKPHPKADIFSINAKFYDLKR